MPSILKDYEKIEIVKKYLTNTFTCVSLSKEYKVSPDAIRGILKRRGIKINRIGSLRRKYSLNEDYFNIIDTVEKAYFLGLLYADGYNSQSNHCVEISLQEGDKLILEEFKKNIQSNIPLVFKNYSNKNKKYKNQYKLNLYSKKLSQKLSDLGCVQNKSLILRFPTEFQVPKKMLKFWLLGLWDGDGCISVTRAKTKRSGDFYYQTYITGSKYLIEEIKNFLQEQLNIHLTIYQGKNRPITRDGRIMGRKQCLKFLDWLYMDSKIYLERKYKKYLLFKKTPKELRNMGYGL